MAKLFPNLSTPIYKNNSCTSPTKPKEIAQNPVKIQGESQSTLRSGHPLPGGWMSIPKWKIVAFLQIWVPE